MELKRTILSAVLLGIGFILHQVTPALGGVTFDIQLAMLFVIIALNMSIKYTVVVSLASGIITALTTKLPGGQIPNIIDKLVTGLIVYAIIILLSKLKNKSIGMAITGLAGTLISGTVFLTSAMVIAGLPASFAVLFSTVVLPTAATNMIITPILLNLVNMSKKMAKFEF